MTLYWKRPPDVLKVVFHLSPSLDPDVVKASPEVELGEDLGLAQGCQCLGDQGDRVLLVNRSSVELSVVDYQPKLPGFAAGAISAGSDEENWCTVRGCG